MAARTSLTRRASETIAIENLHTQTAIIAVQIANPYDTPLALGEFRLEYYGKTFNFTAGAIIAGYGPNPTLPAATLGKPSTAIVFAVEAGAVGSYTVGQFRTAVLDFFDIEKGEMQGSVLQPVDIDGDGLIEYATLYDSQGTLTDPNPATRADPLDRTLVFDATASWDVSDINAPGEPAAANPRYTNTSQQPVQIIRNITPPAGIGGSPIQVVVDRFDNSGTRRQVQRRRQPPVHRPAVHPAREEVQLRCESEPSLHRGHSYSRQRFLHDLVPLEPHLGLGCEFMG